MKARDVIKTENLFKSYVSDGLELTLILKDDLLWLQHKKTGQVIETICGVNELLEMDFVEYIDWCNESIDTKLLVSNDGETWEKRHFAGFKNGCVHCFQFGQTSFTGYTTDSSWKYARIYREPTVDNVDDVIRIEDVMKLENEGKIYKVDGREFILISRYDSPVLEEVGTGKSIESIYNIHGIHNFDTILQLEFEEIFDWSKVQVDEKLLVSDDGETWRRGHFAKFENGVVHTWFFGSTSYTVEKPDKITAWKFAKLYQG